MNIENCFFCNKNEADTDHPLVILLQRKEKINVATIREYKEIPVPVCNKCLKKIKHNINMIEKIGGIAFLLIVIMGVVFFIWGVFHSPKEKSTFGALLALITVIFFIGIGILLLVERLSIHKKTNKYILINILKKDGWRIYAYGQQK